MNTTYELKKDTDGRLWVSVNELMNDIKQCIQKMSSLDEDRLLEDDKKQLDSKIVGLHAIYTFLGALQTEQTLIDKKIELDRQPLMGDVNIKAVQFDVPVEVTKETVH